MTYDPKQPFTIRRCKHGLMAYNLNDAFIGRSLHCYGEWCEFELDLMRALIGGGATVIDVGANIGTHALAFAEMVGPEGAVYALEPQPRLYRLLQANIALNGADNVTPRCVAAGSTYDVIQIADLPPDDVVFNFGSLPLSSAITGSTSLAQQITIDAMGLAPKLIKIDVEGMEDEVIRGANTTIDRHGPALFIECNGSAAEVDEIGMLLGEIGYRAWWSVGPYFNPNNFFGEKQNIWHPDLVPSTNLIATPNGGHVFDLPQFTGEPWANAGR